MASRKKHQSLRFKVGGAKIITKLKKVWAEHMVIDFAPTCAYAVRVRSRDRSDMDWEDEVSFLMCLSFRRCIWICACDIVEASDGTMCVQPRRGDLMFLSLLSLTSTVFQEWKKNGSEGFDAKFSILGLKWSEPTLRRASVEFEQALFKLGDMKWREKKDKPEEPDVHEHPAEHDDAVEDLEEELAIIDDDAAARDLDGDDEDDGPAGDGADEPGGAKKVHSDLKAWVSKADILKKALAAVEADPSMHDEEKLAEAVEGLEGLEESLGLGLGVEAPGPTPPMLDAGEWLLQHWVPGVITTLEAFHEVSNPFNLVPEPAMVCLIERLLQEDEHDEDDLEWTLEWKRVGEWDAGLPLLKVRPCPVKHGCFTFVATDQKQDLSDALSRNHVRLLIPNTRHRIIRNKDMWHEVEPHLRVLRNFHLARLEACAGASSDVGNCCVCHKECDDCPCPLCNLRCHADCMGDLFLGINMQVFWSTCVTTPDLQAHRRALLSHFKEDVHDISSDLRTFANVLCVACEFLAAMARDM